MYITLLLASLMDDLLWSMLMTNARSVKWATSCARRDKLKATGKCHHVCGVATGIYRLCHAMERPVESARVACPNAAYGCAARPAYYEQQAHRQLCLHAPCRCPATPAASSARRRRSWITSPASTAGRAPPRSGPARCPASASRTADQLRVP
jgi:hypothetical protein